MVSSTARDLVTQDETVIVLDVRTPEEYAMGHIEGALNINIAEADFSERVSKLDRDKTYIYTTLRTYNQNSDASYVLQLFLFFKPSAG